MKTAAAIRKKIESLPLGQPFAVTELLHLGTRAAVDQELYRLTKSGEISRVCRGVYVKPEENRYVGKMMPTVQEVAKTKANALGVKIGISGAEAANQMGFTTQVPMVPVFYTNGNPASFKIGNLPVRFKKVHPKQLEHAGTRLGTAIAALWYLGEENANEEAISRIEQQLSEEEFHQLLKSAGTLPGWLASRLYLYGKGDQHVA